MRATLRVLHVLTAPVLRIPHFRRLASDEESDVHWTGNCSVVSAAQPGTVRVLGSPIIVRFRFFVAQFPSNRTVHELSMVPGGFRAEYVLPAPQNDSGARFPRNGEPSPEADHEHERGEIVEFAVPQVPTTRQPNDFLTIVAGRETQPQLDKKANRRSHNSIRGYPPISSSASTLPKVGGVLSTGEAQKQAL